jgi:D-tyrosyl-tRNA(Tyr) deacylase
MKLVIQRVTSASVTIAGILKSSIDSGLLVLAGIADTDTSEDAEWLSQKLVNLRIFNDADGVMNLSVKETGGGLLIISQFTLLASTKKGNRPSYIKAARPEKAIPLYESFLKMAERDMGREVQSGVFGADMKVALLNDGPVTILIDSANKE